MKVTARLNNFRRSAQKVRESVKIVVGLPVGQALVQLENSTRGDAKQLTKLLKSAIANAENNFKLDKDNLFVSNAIVNEGRTLKRWMPRAYGRAAQILKRSCNVILELDETEEGKKAGAVKSGKDGSAKRKPGQARSDQEKKPEGVKKEDDKEEEAKEKDFEQKRIQEELERRGKSQIKGGAGKKVFRRKSF